VRYATHTIHLDAPKSITMLGDKGRITQLFSNLISNAIKYSPHADTVNITLHSNEHSNIVYIQDFGEGMSITEVKNIFRLFYRTSKVKKSTTLGAGIGLYISNQIVHHYGGRIDVQSIKGEGSTFVITLPSKIS